MEQTTPLVGTGKRTVHFKFDGDKWYCKCHEWSAAGRVFNNTDDAQAAHDSIFLVEGKKFDDDKVRVDLIPADVLWQVAKVFTAGAKKYGDRNWEAGIDNARTYGAALRHMLLWHQGETKDEEGLDHLACAIAELMFTYAYELRGMKEYDSRPLRTS